MPYVILLIFSIFWGTTLNLLKGLKSQIDLYLIPVFIIASLIAGFRGLTVGVDTLAYYHIYNTVSNLSYIDLISNSKIELEIGFGLICKLTSTLGFSYFGFQLLLCSIINFFVFKFIRYNTYNVVTSTIIFFSQIYLLEFNIVRQVFAVILAANAWTMIVKNNIYYSILFFLLAISMHSSAIISLIPISIWYCRNFKYTYIAVSFLLVLFYFFFFIFIDVFRNLDFYTYYLNNTLVTQEVNNVIYFWYIVLLLSVFILFKCKETKRKFIALMSLIWFTCNLISLQFNYFERVALYFSPFMLLLLSDFGNNIRNLFLKSCYYIGVILCFSFFFYLGSQTSQYKYIFF